MALRDEAVRKHAHLLARKVWGGNKSRHLNGKASLTEKQQAEARKYAAFMLKHIRSS